MDKISPKASAELRNEMYDKIEVVFADGESTVDGFTVCLDAEQNIYATVKVTVHDNTKFSIEDKRTEFAEKQAATAARTADKAAKAEEKAKKAAEKAAKEAK
jgi:hypothetical protein